ncbi:unnamed protein product [Larinioides sclopetarius]|uniref:LRRCT domain-containing protein n=1 Tax=Larinioides sclopetarius TaxID=280406 RepID=A0AAV2AC56_9ARAC
MNFLPILLFGAGVVGCVYSNGISSRYDTENLCPPPDNIAPCTCFNSPVSNRITARCSNFTNANELKSIFNKNPDWDLQDVWIDQCALPFLPAKMLEKAHFQSLNVTSTSLFALFDTTPVTTPELNLYLYDVSILSSLRWRDFVNLSLLEFTTVNLTITSLGQDFKDHFPKGVQRLWFENTRITSIQNQALSSLTKLQYLVIKRGSLKKLSRDMFPRPWNVIYLDFSYQKIAALPEDFFTDLPQLSYFLFEGNQLSTLSEKVFTNYSAFYVLNGNPFTCNCNIKWIVEKIQPVFLQGECTEPESLKGKQLKSLNADDFRYCH